MALGPYFGFVTGCCEIIGNTCYITTAVIPLGLMMCNATQTPRYMELVFWGVFFIPAFILHLNNGRIFWGFITVAGIVSLLILIVYILSTAPTANFNKYALQNNVENNGESFRKANFIDVMPLGTWFYIGSAIMPMAGSDCEKVRLYLLCSTNPGFTSALFKII